MESPSLQAMCDHSCRRTHLSRCVSPRQGRKKNSYIVGEATFSKHVTIWETLQSNIWSAKQISLDLPYAPSDAPWYKISYFCATTRIWPQGPKKSSKNIVLERPRAQKIRNHDAPRFALTVFYKVLHSVSTGHININCNANAPAKVREPPAGLEQINNMDGDNIFCF